MTFDEFVNILRAIAALTTITRNATANRRHTTKEQQ